jgi:hypothetical protein
MLNGRSRAFHSSIEGLRFCRIFFFLLDEEFSDVFLDWILRNVLEMLHSPLPLGQVLGWVRS